MTGGVRVFFQSLVSLALTGLLVIFLGSGHLLYKNIRRELPRGIRVNSHSVAGKTISQVMEELDARGVSTVKVHLVLPDGAVLDVWDLAIAAMGDAYPALDIREHLEEFFVLDTYLRLGLARKGIGHDIVVPFLVDDLQVLGYAHVLTQSFGSEPVEARVLVEQGRIVVIEDRLGYRVSPEELFRVLQKGFATGFAEDMFVSVEVLYPRITKDALADYSKVLSHQSSPLGEDPHRKINILIANDLVDGYALLPEESFSFLEVVGRASAERGFMPAPVIISQRVVDAYGGGICQVSSTLYQAALRADLLIVSRRNHSLPVTYLPMGMDAAVSYPSLDLVIQNPYPYPVLISAWSDEEETHVTIFGPSLHVTKTMDVVIGDIQVFEPPLEMIPDTSLPVGTEIVEQVGELGYRVWVYREVKTAEGKIERELVSVDSYSSLAKIVRQGVKKTAGKE